MLHYHIVIDTTHTGSVDNYRGCVYVFLKKDFVKLKLLSKKLPNKIKLKHKLAKRIFIASVAQSSSIDIIHQLLHIIKWDVIYSSQVDKMYKNKSGINVITLPEYIEHTITYSIPSDGLKFAAFAFGYIDTAISAYYLSIKGTHYDCNGNIQKTTGNTRLL